MNQIKTEIQMDLFGWEGELSTTSLKESVRRSRSSKSKAVEKSTVLVHESCLSALEALRPLFTDPKQSKALMALADELNRKRTSETPTNVAQVKQLSPFRYPGGKTWLVPEVKKWIECSGRSPSIFVEPFAGGAMVGLTVAYERLATQVLLSEIDEDVAAVWSSIFQGTDAEVKWLQKKIISFEVNLENVRRILSEKAETIPQKAFRTIIKNRMQRGGIMAPGAGLVKSGEAGRGLRSRWYPETLAKRIEVLREIKESVTFVSEDAFKVIEKFRSDSQAFFFIDPPYTAGGKKAGKRLYAHNEINHKALFEKIADVRGPAMLTYDDSVEVRALAKRHDFKIKMVPMKNTHHAIVYELLILKS